MTDLKMRLRLHQGAVSELAEILDDDVDGPREVPYEATLLAYEQEVERTAILRAAFERIADDE